MQKAVTNMPSSESVTPTTSQDNPETLLSHVRDSAQPDSYAGKRRWTRWKAGIPLEIAKDTADPSAIQRGSMQNVSGGGIAFWSKTTLGFTDPIWIREFSPEEPLPWMPARVVHCTRGIRGFLIGAEFDNPNPPEA